MAPYSLSDIERVFGAVRSHHQGFDSQAVVVHRARGRRKVEDVVNLLCIEWPANIRLDELKLRLSLQMFEILERTGAEVIDANDGVAIGEQCIREMRAEKACCTGDQDTHQACSPAAGLFFGVWNTVIGSMGCDRPGRPTLR